MKRILWLVALLCLTACEPGPESPQPRKDISSAIPDRDDNEGWAVHIVDAPGGWLPQTGALHIRFSHEIGPELAGSADSEAKGLVTIEPAIPLSISLVASDTLQITPQQPFERGTEYTLTLFPQRLSSVSNALAPFQTRFRILHQDLGVEIGNLEVQAPSENYFLTGKLTTTDVASSADISRSVSAWLDSEEVPLSWYQTDPLTHEFSIADIKRKAKPGKLTIRWQGEPLGVDKAGEESVIIPGSGEFGLVGIRYARNAGNSLEISFSEPLSGQQDLAGMVSINGDSASRVTVDGNRLIAFPANPLSGDISISVAAGLQTARGIRSAQPFTGTIQVNSERPGVRLVDNTNLIPDGNNFRVPLEAINVDSVQLTLYQLPGSNLKQFLQQGSLTRQWIDSNTTRPLWRKTYPLPKIPRDQWQRFTLDLSEQVKALNNDPLAVEVSISQANSIIQCDQPRPGPDDSLPDPESWATDADNPPAWVRRFYQNERYRWQNRDNPCTPEFYAYGNYETRDVSYYYQSSLGLIAKLGQDHQLRVVVTDVRNAEAVSGASVTAYNRQNQIVADGKTNNEGMVTLSPLAPPAYLMVNHNDQAGFLRLDRNEALSTNVFDIRGESVSNGLKGYFYGERGIWRPGDDIYLTFILHDRAGSLPADFPLSVDFFNPQGAKVSTITQTSPIEGFYHFHLGTSADAPTGNWRAVVRIGTRYFSKIIPVETVKPNKLKLALTLPAPTLRWQPTNAPDTHLFAQWLNGASANGLRATVSARPASTTTSIAGYSQFIFDDPVRRLTNEEQALFEGTLDPSGWATFKINPQMPEAPGQVSLHLTSRVFEKSGNFSIQYQTVPYIPFQRLVGLNLPEGQGWNNAMGRDEQHELQLVLLDQQSQPLADQSLNLAVYRLDWRWWWESGADNLANYLGSNAASRLVNETLTTNDAGLARWQLNGQDFDWGRYLIRACDDKGSHCTGKVIYLGWSDNNRQDPGAASQLTLATDKLDYVPGETAMIQLPDNLPGPDQAAVLLTIESGSGVLSQRWIEQDIQQHHYGLSITEAMAPNVYAHITVLQKYDGKTSDTPLRLYGIVPVVVNNPATRLLPVLNVPERIKPLSPLTVSVSEASGKPMTYTLAVVDEGLLGLTGFRTPDPQAALYQREALGVLTWDLFDQFPAGKDTQSTLMTIGGGQAAAEALNKHLQKRFKPVVRFLGPFTLTAGATAEHRTDIPDYMGAVRVMVVAGSRQGELPAYGYAGTTVTVTQALGVVTTLPRVLAPGESISLPVNIFNNRSDIGEVDVQITTNGLLEAATEIQTVGFSEPGDQIITVPLRVLENTGEAEVTVTVSGGGESATERLTVPVRSPNTIQTDTRTIVVAANSRATLTLPVNGIPGSNQSLIEVSRLPALNLNERLSYLLEYPHGCLEQTTSGLFAQLYLGKLTTLTDEQTRAAERHVRQGIIRLKDYQSDRGNFHYWPGSQYRNDWANTWAGHFLLEARNQGYTVPADMLSRWLTDQRNRAKQSGFRPGYEATDAYLLFSLALAEQPDFGAMNRLRQMLIADDVRTSNMNLARWLLAAAYGLAGQPEAGQPLLAAADLSTSSYSTAGYTFGSRLRDTAVLALAQLAAGERTQAWQALRQLATGMNEADWVSTQTSGWALLALSSYYGEQDVTAQAFRWRQAQAPWLDTALQSPVFQSRLPADAGTEISVELDNQSPDPLYLLLSNRGIPAAGDETAASSQLHMSASYSTLEGKPLSPALIPQGEDFIATVVISAADPSRQLDNLALTMIMPGGWELSNARLQGGSLPGGLDHQDIRDDRVMSYFSLSPDQPELVLNFTLNATYAGRYYLPGWHTEAMYNHDIYSRLKGQWVRVQPN